MQRQLHDCCRLCITDAAVACICLLRPCALPVQLPVLKMLLRTSEINQYCGNEPLLTQHNSTAPGATAPGGWFKITVPLSVFGCAGAGLPLDQVTQFDIQNQIGKRNPERNAVVCIGDVTIVH